VRTRAEHRRRVGGRCDAVHRRRGAEHRRWSGVGDRACRSRRDERAYPQIATLWNAAGRAMAASIGGQCIEQYVANFPFKKLSAYTTVSAPLQLPWVRAILNANRLGARKPSAPLFIYQAVADELIPMAGVNALVARYCSLGVAVTYYQDVASEHISLAVSGAPAATAYLAARFSGARAPSTCGLPMIPGAVPRVLRARRLWSAEVSTTDRAEDLIAARR
jgi:hypothetical protein